MAILRKHQAGNFAEKVNVTAMQWPSTAHDDVDACKYIGPDDDVFDQTRTVHAWIPHTLPDVTTHDQEYMFTLPDMFLPLPEDFSTVALHRIQAIKSELEKDEYNTTEKEWSDEKFWPSLDIDDVDAVREYNKLRNSSKYIGTSFTADGQVIHTLKLNMPLDEPFKAIIAGIRRRIGARPNEDSP
jgi:hypothetical protein